MILDLIILAVIILCIIFGYKRGLVEVAFNLISFIIAIVLSFMLYQPVTNYIIDNTEFDENIKSVIVNHINPEEIQEQAEEPEKESNNLPDIVTNYIGKSISEAANTAKNNVTDVVATNLSITAIKIITLILLFIVIRIVLCLLKFLTNMLAKLPVINRE